MDAEPGQEKAPQVPQSILRAALIRRAVEDIHRIIQIRTAKQACSTLLQRGSVGDDLWQRFTRAEGEMEAELRDVVMEVRNVFASLPFPPRSCARAACSWREREKTWDTGSVRPGRRTGKKNTPKLIPRQQPNRPTHWHRTGASRYSRTRTRLPPTACFMPR